MATTKELRQRAKRSWADPEIKSRILLGQEKAREAKRLSGPSVSDRFWARVRKDATPEGCWLWQGNLNNKGYGSIRIKPKRAGGPTLVHRYAYELLVGPIPEGKELDHLCKNRHCVSPAHLEVVTRSENCSRGNSGHAWALHQRAKTHCPQGHPYDLLNTYFPPRGGRQCRICRRETIRRLRAYGHGFTTPRGDVVCHSEEEVFRAVGLLYVPPERRE